MVLWYCGLLTTAVCLHCLSVCPGLRRLRRVRAGRGGSWRSGRAGRENTGRQQHVDMGSQEGGRNKTNQDNTTPHVNPSQIYYSQEQLDQEKLLPLVICALLYYRLIYTERLLLRDVSRCCLVF